MKTPIQIVLFLILIATLNMSCSTVKTEESIESDAPVAQKIPKELVTSGHKRIDNYYWMRLSEEQKNATEKDDQTEMVLNHLNAENDYLKKKLKHTDSLQEKLYNEMVGRIKQRDESVPFKDNGYWYYTRYEEGKEYPIYCRKKGDPSAKEDVLINVNELAEGHNYFSIVGLKVSEDNKYLAYAEDTVSRRRYTIYVKDLASGKIIDTPVPNTEGDITWANDNRTFFYTRKDSATLRSRWIVKHKVGTPPEKDQAIYEEKDETFYTGIYKTKSDKYLVIRSTSTITSDHLILEANNPDGAFRPFTERKRGIEYAIDHHNDRFFIVTNLDAQNFRLMEVKESTTSIENWKEKIPHRADTLLEEIEVFKDHLVVKGRANANNVVGVIDLRTNSKHYVTFQEPAYTLYPASNVDFNTNTFRFVYTSLSTPTSTYDYNMDTRERKLLKRQEVVGGHNADDYEVERVWATAKDGTKIPMSLVYKKGIKKDGTNPFLLYGYGSYGYSTDPTFSSTRLSLLERGFIFGIAHIRGGQEMGRKWYENGKMFNKKNTFTDFIACSEFAIEEKYTSPDKLFAAGGSAGGLLMGAVVNMRPDLYKGVIAAVPFVDVVSTMLDETIPLTTGEFDEWGNPKNQESYMYMLDYSPYDQVKPQNYPNMLVTTGLHDSQVQYWEPAKWVAKLREQKTDDNIILLRTNMETGHGGTTGRFRVYRETAQEYAFLLDLADIKQ